MNKKDDKEQKSLFMLLLLLSIANERIFAAFIISTKKDEWNPLETFHEIALFFNSCIDLFDYNRNFASAYLAMSFPSILFANCDS